MTGNKRIILPDAGQGARDFPGPDELSRAGDAPFRLLTDALPQIVWTMQPDGRFTYFNQRWLDYSGCSLQDSLGHGWMQRVHPDDRLRVSGFWAQARASNDPCEIDCRLFRADGVYRWMLARAVAQLDAAGQATQWIGTLTDIDNLKQSNERGEKNLSMNRMAGRVTQLGGWTIELPERTLTWSDENCLIHDVPPGYTPTLDEDRIPALEAQLITTLESITDGFCLIDKDWKFTFLNSQAERLLKRCRHDLLGKTLWQEFPEAVGTRTERECRLALQKQRATRFKSFYPPLNLCLHFHVYPTQEGLAVYFQDITQRRAEQAQLRLLNTPVSRLNENTMDGKERWLETDIAPIADKSGKFTHWGAVERDITERRQQQEILNLNTQLEERVLLRTFELERANRELESFAYSVSHDLRSPLNTIHAFSQLVVKIDGDQVSAKGRHYLKRIGVSVKHMGELIEGLLTLAQVSRKQINPEPVDLSDIARRIARDYRKREPGRQTQWHIQDGLRAQGDARLLSLLLQNLLNNAWKFTSQELLAHIEVGSEPGVGGNTVFYVRDNGAGFDMAFAPKLFGTFERLHSPQEFSGTGVGLATVKRIIDRHAGRVWAQSLPNQGAGFFFTLGRRHGSPP